jgi:hypothetical protein
MLAPITALTTYGTGPASFAPGPSPVVGPVVSLSFTLQLAGPVPSALQLTPLQACQNSCPNVALGVAVVDQRGNAVDLSTATGLLFWLLAPDGTVRAVPAVLTDNGLDGLLQHVTTAQDLNEAGQWSIQAQVTFGTQILLTTWGQFTAGTNIPDGGVF